ncbi:hypothetical protein ABBQ38_003380 [Trebouxia sp. C0009 RCD-2024]
MAAVRAASFTVGADEMLQELLCQEQLQHLPPADVASLLTTCLMECPDRECAVSLVKLITLTLTTSVQASPTVQQAPAWNTASGSRASSHRRLPQGDETKAYVLHWSSLLTLDLLAEMQETLMGLNTPFQLPSQAADQNGFVPAQTTVWDYIAQKTDNPEFAKAVKALHSTPHTGRSRSNVGKPPVVLHNVCASCREDKPGEEDSCHAEFASNTGGPLGEGQFQPGDLVRLSLMTCQQSTVPFAAYSKHFVEGNQVSTSKFGNSKAKSAVVLLGL